MTHQEARRIVEATTRFEAQGGCVWLREVRWLRAVDRQRREETASQTAIGVAPALGSRRTRHTPEPDERQPAPAP